MGPDGLYLGLDVGTQGTKGLILDAASGRVVARASATYGLIPGLPEGAAEQDPETWIAAVADVVRDLLRAAGGAGPRIRGAGVSGQQHGCVVLDASDRPVRPAKLWCDTSTAAEAEELGRTLGRRVPAGFTASKLLWLKRREPERWARVRSVLLPHDYVNFRLTGQKAMEAGDASGTGFFDPCARAFDARAMGAIDPSLTELLPRLLPAGAPAGEVSAAGSALTGLPEGVPVAAGGGDNMMSAIGSGATRPGVVVVSLGTSGTVFTYSRTPVVDPEGLVAPFCDSTGGWLPLLCTMNVTGVTEEVRAAFTDGSKAALEGLTRDAALVPAGCDGLLFLPFLQGERVPDLPLASGTLLGLRAGHLRPAVLFRAAIEGTTLNLQWGVDRIRRLGVEVSGVRLVGGGSRNLLWRQVVADALGVPVRLPVESESAALGAALQALWTARRREEPGLAANDAAAPHVAVEPGAIEPDPARVRTYRDAGDRFRDAVRRLHGAG